MHSNSGQGTDKIPEMYVVCSRALQFLKFGASRDKKISPVQTHLSCELTSKLRQEAVFNSSYHLHHMIPGCYWGYLNQLGLPEGDKSN